MRSLITGFRRLAKELRRRRVHRVAGLYAVTLFVGLQIADVTFEPLGIPEFWLALLVVVGVAAFPVVLVMAWMFDITDEGLQQASPGRLIELLGRSPATRSVTILGTAALSVGLGWVAWNLRRSAVDLPTSSGTTEGGYGSERPSLDPRRIAVLYLDDHSADGSLGYLAAALTEGLLHELGNVEGLDVSSRNAVKPFRYVSVSMDSIVRTLRVGSIVEGSVTRSDNRVRATVQLIDGNSLTHLGSRIVDGDLTDPIAFQDSLTLYVARSLRQRLGREIRIRAAQSGTADVDAWTAFAQGREALEEYTVFREDDVQAALSSLSRADSLFQDAAHHDPDWLGPVLERAEVVSRVAALRGPLPGSLDTLWAARADSLLEVVLRRDPQSAAALEQRGWLEARLARTRGVTDLARHLEAAEENLRAALRIEADRPEAWWILSEVLVRQARFAEAVEAAEHALAADAFLEVEPQALHSLYYSVVQLGPRDEAIRLCNEGRRRFPLNPNFVACRYYLLGSFPQVEPDVEHAWALLDSLNEASPEGTRSTWLTFGQVWLSGVIARAGMADSARAVLSLVREPGQTPPALAYDEAHVQLLLGDEAEAVRLLRLFLQEDADTAFLREDWWFEELRNYRPFQDLVGLMPGQR